MATDTAVDKIVLAEVYTLPLQELKRGEPKATLAFYGKNCERRRKPVIQVHILRRACEWQACFASEKVESVANVTAFASPVAFPLLNQVDE